MKHLKRISLILFALISASFIACSDDSTSEVAPSLTTSPITNITATTASGGGDVTDDGGVTVTARGVCWSTSENPTIAGNHSTDSSGTGSFTSSITGLSPNTTYYVTAYATNSTGTNYGSQVTFTTYGTFTDTRDGHVYKTIQIGTQVWMAENLDYRTSDSSWYYSDDSTTYHIYGRLYAWHRALTSAPQGWHLPTDAEWTTLTTYLGGDSIAGGKLKEAGTAHWLSPNTGANNESGFTALPGGFRDNDSQAFVYLGYNGYCWSATEYDATSAWFRGLSYNASSVNVFRKYGKTAGFSVRCVRD